MVVIVGDTFTVMVGAVPLNAVPLDSVPLMVPLPVTVRVSVVVWPLQILAVPLSTAVGRAFTVTTALPVKSAAMALQLASERVATVYVVFIEGDTTTVIVGAVPLNTAPLESVPLIVPLPVTVSVKVALVPLQTVVVPLISAVGRALTFTVALPLRSPAIAAQLASDRVAIV